VVGSLQACGSRGRDERPSGLAAVTSGSDSGSGGGFDAGLPDKPCEGTGFCGNEIHTIAFDAPNVYFVFDRSGSMLDVAPGFEQSSYDVVRDSALSMVRDLGPLINVGAATFPKGLIGNNGCTIGGEVFGVTPGDPPGDYPSDEGPTTTAFRQATNVTPAGGTPIGATLQLLRPTLEQLSGRTIVLLLTDGGPNCNEALACTAAECQINIEGDCPPGDNCCEPQSLLGGPSFCVDRIDTLAAISALHGAGIDVYVIGIAGSEFYEGLLDEMAVAGGTAQPSPPQYVKVDDLQQLSQVFAGIAAENIDCSIGLSDAPTTQDMTNVYLDCELIAQSPDDGWVWQDGTTVQLTGNACLRLKAGQVAEVQVVTGCPTEVPK
jgi:hypothetical protein